MTILKHTWNIQDNGYYCGPATILVVDSCRGVVTTEAQAALEAGTTVNGTPSIQNIANVLNDDLGAGSYRTVWINGLDATAEQVQQLKVDIVQSIDAGWGVAINVVGTATTADGREVNSYSGGHYIPVVGYDQGGDLIFCSDVADGHEYYMKVGELATWIAQRGYATLAHGKVEDDVLKAILTHDVNDDYIFIVPSAGGWRRGPTKAQVAANQWVLQNALDSFTIAGMAVDQVTWAAGKYDFSSAEVIAQWGPDLGAAVAVGGGVGEHTHVPGGVA